MTQNDAKAAGAGARPQSAAYRKGTLAAVLGSAAAAIALLVATPHEESGRKVEATIATDGTATIKHVSGPQYLKAYLDIVKVPTACDGITRGVKLGQTYSPSQCAQLLERELVIHAEGVMACTPGLKGRPQQQIAAVLLTYNIGVAAYCRSTVDRRFDAGQWRAGCDAILMWDKAGGKVVRGLQLRRQRERQICLKGL